jgi:hypothetical protein
MSKLRSMVCLCAALSILAWCGVAQAVKPFEKSSRRLHPSACPAGSTNLCIPLDGTFSIVSFNDGSVDPTDPCQRNDDASTLAIDLPFTFNLYGTSYSQVFINSNGNLSFDTSYDEFTSTGFPMAGIPMVAALWADVDTRNDSTGVVWYKLETHRLTVIWDHVGYYWQHADLRNTFELILSDGTDPVLGIGNNVGFCYDDMQWTTGDVSGGSAGFGGTPATAGVNKGDGVNYIQLGRFGVAGGAYDGPGGATDGVDWLDRRHVFLSVSTGSGDNVAPVEIGFPPDAAWWVCADHCDTLVTAFTSPEVGQITSTSLDLHGLANATLETTAGNPSLQELRFCPTEAQIGDYTVTYTATDDGDPAMQTVLNLTVHVRHCNTAIAPRSWSQIKTLYR